LIDLVSSCVAEIVVWFGFEMFSADEKLSVIACGQFYEVV